jgi:pseudouridine synthase
LARAGYGSRRFCEGLILEGRVQVNGRVVRTLGTRVHPDTDRVQVDGETARAAVGMTIMLHKLAGYITSRSDPEGRPVVMDLLPPGKFSGLFPVGRLDWETEGLLLLTNDGELAQRLIHPRHAVAKVYHAKVKNRPTPEGLERLRRGVVSEGERLVADEAGFLQRTRENSWIRLSLTQGRNRQVRRMCEAIGHPILKLVRVAVGPLVLGDLPRGHWRYLNPEEEALLKQMSGLPEAGRP